MRRPLRRKLAKAFTPAAVSWGREALQLQRERGVRVKDYPSARAARIHLVPKWIDLRAGVFVDLGANVGEWTIDVARSMPHTSIVAVEPSPTVYEQLFANTRHLPQVETLAKAVADENGRAVFHVTNSSVFGSLLAPTLDGTRAYAGSARVKDTVEVEVTTLDDLLDERPVSLLKIDVQGAELKVIAGGKDVLSRTSAIIAEMNFLTLYQDGSSAGTLHQAFAEVGFTAWSMAPPTYAPDGRLSNADVCYVRDAPPLS